MESNLNAEAPSSPLRPDRDGFNREHPFAKGLLEFIAEQLRPIYEKERKRLEEKEQGGLSSETKKRIDDALKQLNKYFRKITELADQGPGGDEEPPKAPVEPVAFFPQRTKLIAGRSRSVLLLVREDTVKNRAEVVATATEGIAGQSHLKSLVRQGVTRWQNG